MLVGCGYKKGTTLFGYGYDFRQSNRIDKALNGLKEKLEIAYKASGGRKVNIISHSMGGLLLSCFMSLHNDVFAEYVNKWISIACPFQGSPGCINDSLLTGLQFVEGFESYFFVSRWTMHQLLVECPSIYEMLPNPEFKWKKQPQIHVWRKQSNDGEVSVKLESYGPNESVTLFEEALRNNEEAVQDSVSATVCCFFLFGFLVDLWCAFSQCWLHTGGLLLGSGFLGTNLSMRRSPCTAQFSRVVLDPLLCTLVVLQLAISRDEE
ncbi:unnamed protein product [Ilex paraguariensis]|uniref:Uncharacterized protein n=1 Tax=Ilex paraguariensis TaxID=185542 RepID=A0ABC8SE47_9AQUA